MIKRIIEWFKPKVVEKFTIVELEKQSPLIEDASSVAEVQSLRTHSGFQWLVKKLKIQSARLQAELNTSRNVNNEDVYFKTGIFWCNWLSNQVDFARDRYLNMRPATPQESMHLQDISPMIDLIGVQDATSV